MSASKEGAGREGVSFLLHTRNRSSFLFRALRYLDELNEHSSRCVLVLDGSDKRHWAILKEKFAEYEFTSSIELRHSPATTPLRERLRDALAEVKTEYCCLAADDDFYLGDWLQGAVRELESDPQLAVIYGHVIFFTLNAYEPSGELQQYFVHPRRIPPISWLEGNSASERLRAVSDRRTAPSVPGWYALHRTDHLRRIMDHACRIQLPDVYLEYWLVFYQAVLGKTRMMDRITLCRQENPDAVHRTPSLKVARPWLNKMSREFIQLIREHEPLDELTIGELVRDYISGIERELQWADPQSLWQVVRRNRLMRLFWHTLLRRPASAAEHSASSYPDPRLPQIPKIGPDHFAVRLIARWTDSRRQC